MESQKLIPIKEDQIISVKNPDDEVVRTKGGEQDLCKKEKRQKRKLKEIESGANFEKRRKMEVNTEKPKHVNMVKIEEGKTVEATIAEKNDDDDMKLCIEDVDGIQSSVAVNDLDVDGIQISVAVNDLDVDGIQSSVAVNDLDVDGIQSSVAVNDLDVDGIQSSVAVNDLNVDEIQNSVAVNDKSTGKLKDKRSANDTELVYGKLFTKEEDDIIRKAVSDYIDEHELGEQGIDMLLNNREHHNLRGCWNEIAKALPHRPRKSTIQHARYIFKKSNRAGTKEEEIDSINKMHDIKVNTEKPKHVNGVKVDDRKRVEATTEENNDDDEAGLVHGKFFTKEEDDIIRKAVLDYVEEQQLGEEGVDMVLNSREHRKLKGCWKEIAKALPHRPRNSIIQRAHNIFKRSNRAWTKEEIEYINKMHETRGGDWAFMSKELGRYAVHISDVYRKTKSPFFKKGRWSQDEYQALFDLVHADLEGKVLSGEKKKSKHGMLKDNIGWSGISDKLGTRHNAWCCNKWYNSLSSRMVEDGTWENSDDYRMLSALYKLDASCEEEVEWDDLMEHRTGECCRMRWKQMVRHIGEHGSKSFSEQVEVLSKRYCPKMLDAREEWDSRPVVD